MGFVSDSLRCVTSSCPSLNAGKVFLQGREEVADDRHAPGPAEQSLPGQAAHVGHVRVVHGEPEHPAGGTRDGEGSGAGRGRDSARRFPPRWYLSISVHHRMSSFSFMNTGKCWSLPCLMELERVVMVRTLLNCRRQGLVRLGWDGAPGRATPTLGDLIHPS